MREHMPAVVGFEEVFSLVTERAKNRKGRYLIAVAGQSASGKSTFAERLAEALKSNGTDATVVPVDMLYIAETKDAAGILGNYDHPLLIGYSGREVQEIALEVKEGAERMHLPVYSFKTGTREGSKELPVGDVVIFEGLYSIDFLEGIADLKIYVEPWSEIEGILRRAVRDIKRAGLLPEKTVQLLVGAAVMWKHYGKKQREKADIVVVNDYKILEEIGRKEYQARVPEGAVDLEVAEKMAESKEVYRFCEHRYREKNHHGSIELKVRLYINPKGLPEATELSFRTMPEKKGSYRAHRYWVYRSPSRGLYTNVLALLEIAEIPCIGNSYRERVEYVTPLGRIRKDRGSIELAASSPERLEKLARKIGVAGNLSPLSYAELF